MNKSLSIGFLALALGVTLGFSLPAWAAAAPLSFDMGMRHLLIPKSCKTGIPSVTEGVLDRYGENRSNNTEQIKQLILSGSAIVYPSDFKEIPKIKNFLLLEARARDSRTGCLWQKPGIIRMADNIGATGEFMIVEGRVNDVFQSRNNVFLNFGKDWKTDFTIRVENSNDYFKDIDLNYYKNKMIRARGFVGFYNGPSLTLAHPVLLEEISNDTPP